MNLYDKINQVFLERLQDAIDNHKNFNWQKPWKGGTYARNWLTEKPYRGINTLILDPGEYLTFKQIKEIQSKHKEVHLKAGSKASAIYFYCSIEKEDEETGEIKQSTFLKYYNVFNICDVEGIKSKFDDVDFVHDPIEDAEKVVSDYVTREGIKLTCDQFSNQAFYAPATDSITVPDMHQFEKVQEYYSTVFHEIGHSTGAVTRLNRIGITTSGFGSKEYAREELIAELFSVFMMNHVNINSDEVQRNSIAYLQSWYQRIKEDSSLIMYAASRAQKAIDFVIDTQPEVACEPSEGEKSSDSLSAVTVFG